MRSIANRGDRYAGSIVHEGPDGSGYGFWIGICADHQNFGIWRARHLGDIRTIGNQERILGSGGKLSNDPDDPERNSMILMVGFELQSKIDGVALPELIVVDRFL